jgi:hypothetical protein
MLNAPQVTPGKAAQVMATLPVNPPLGVTVAVELPLFPAVTVTALPLTVNGAITVKSAVGVADDA